MKIILMFSILMFNLLPSFVGAEEYNPARSWDRHFNLYLILMVIVWLVVTIPLLYFIFKYRRKERKDGAYISGNNLLEIIWTIVPLIIVLLLGVQTWAVYKEYRATPKDAYEIKVEGFMWGWDVTYPEGIKTKNELRVPVGRAVKVNLTSRDVLHAFFIPEYRVQEEAIPGRTTYLWFKPTKAGEFRAYCTEFCGTGHSMMLAKVIAMENADFNTWIAREGKVSEVISPVERGKKLIDDLGCLNCHTLTGEESAGPTLKGLYGIERVLADGRRVIADSEYIEHAMESPNEAVVKGYDPIMPVYKLSQEDEHAIVEYIKTLK